jgi:hypothetical protein
MTGRVNFVDDTILAFGPRAAIHVLPATHGTGTEGSFFRSTFAAVILGEHQNQVLLLHAVVASYRAGSRKNPLFDPFQYGVGLDRA